MKWIYLLILLFIIIFLAVCKFRHIKVIRIFGCELFSILICVLFLTILIGEILLPMPQYYIKHRVNISANSSEINKKLSLNRILEEEVLKSGVKFDTGSFEIRDSYGMHFNHLFLCSYKINGKEEARVFHFEKNIFGNMKPKYPFNEEYIIPKESNKDEFYRTYVGDGIFGGYLVTAGFASESTILENYQLNKFRLEQMHPTNYFMWVEMVREPWKSELVRVILIAIIIYITKSFGKRDREPIKFYSIWRKGDKIFQCIREDDNL